MGFSLDLLMVMLNNFGCIIGIFGSLSTVAVQLIVQCTCVHACDGHVVITVM